MEKSRKRHTGATATLPSTVARPAPNTPHAQALNEDTGEDDIEDHSAHRQDHRGHRVPLGLPHRLEGGKNKGKDQLEGAHLKIGDATGKDVSGSAGKCHHPWRGQIEEQVEHHAEKNGHDQKDPRIFPGLLPALRPQKLAHHRHAGHPKPHLKGGKDVNERPGDGDSCLSRHRIGGLTDEKGVHQFIEGLHEVGAEDGQRQREECFIQVGLIKQQSPAVLFHDPAPFLFLR